MFCFVIANGQKKNLQVGDICPDIALNSITNYKTSTATISDFKGRLLILDFWATWCAPCVSMLPFEDTLQKEFDGRIQILPVTDQSSSIVTAFLRNLQKYKHFMMPSVTQDTVLGQLFPHGEIPHYVWIDKDSRVIAITGAEQIKKEIINSVLNNTVATLPEKKDSFKVIDYDKPMFATGNILLTDKGSEFSLVNNENVLYHSVITRYIDGFGSEQGSDSSKITCKNSSIGDLYRIAAGHYTLLNLEQNSTIWETSNPIVQLFSDSAAERYSANKTAILNWMSKHTFCYELKFPVEMNAKKYDIMLRELNNYFGALYNINCRIENRHVMCLALMKVPGFIQSNSADKHLKYSLDQYHLQVSNATTKALLGILSINLDTLPPLVDETGYTGRVTLNLNCNMSDVRSINQSMGPYGLQLIEKMCNRDMIVIKDEKDGIVNQLNAGDKE